nr:TetR/AcrR family transcriptional regulator [Kibdelosporangium sp. MJ126-NF4]CEL15184.1 Transcriptional regulator, TetR family [Kibdelosporangium sp. MJ126-NF4]CTQ93220.1 Transcriptional regulator, TetR family [Kibdelosporangium sp. MJ126-NF4]
MESPTRASDRLLDAALDCFAAYGVRKTSVRDVAARAGVSATTAYRAFATKPDLVAAVFRMEVGKFSTAYAKIAKAAADHEDLLRQTVPFVLGYFREHPVVSRIIADEPEQILGLLVQHGDEPTALELIRPTAEAAIVDGGSPEHLRGTPAQIAEWCVRMLISFHLVPRTTLTGEDQITELLLHGVAQASAAAEPRRPQH